MYCSKCGAPNDDNNYKCLACGEVLHPESRGPVYVNEGAGLERLIPARNPPALWGYYLGVFSLIPCLGLGLGPAAVVCGWIGLKKAKELPNRIGRTHAWVALVAGGLAALFNWGWALVALVAVSSKR